MPINFTAEELTALEQACFTIDNVTPLGRARLKIKNEHQRIIEDKEAAERAGEEAVLAPL